MKQDFDFKEDGIQIFYNFIDSQIIESLRTEALNLFKYTQILGPEYCVRLNNYVSEIPNPTVKIKSLNLLETAVDISEQLIIQGYENYKLAHIALYHESNNPKELVWHSDMRNGGLIRAQIVILGGELNSGAFRYVKGSHKLKSVDYAPPKGFLESNKENVVVCDKENGSLFLIDTVGYHSKCVCNDTRISLMFDFLPESYIKNNPNDVVSDVNLSASRLSSKVINNISLFVSGVESSSNSINTYDNYKYYKPFSNSKLFDFINVIRLIFKNRIGK